MVPACERKCKNGLAKVWRAVGAYGRNVSCDYGIEPIDGRAINSLVLSVYNYRFAVWAFMSGSTDKHRQ